MLDISVVDVATGKQVSNNANPIVPPKLMALLKATVSFAIGAGTAAGADHADHQDTNTTALYVVLTTAAEGRFSENAFVLEAPSKVVDFISWRNGGVDIAQRAQLASSLRVEHHPAGEPRRPGSGDREWVRRCVA